MAGEDGTDTDTTTDDDDDGSAVVVEATPAGTSDDDDDDDEDTKDTDAEDTDAGSGCGGPPARVPPRMRIRLRMGAKAGGGAGTAAAKDRSGSVASAASAGVGGSVASSTGMAVATAVPSPSPSPSPPSPPPPANPPSPSPPRRAAPISSFSSPALASPWAAAPARLRAPPPSLSRPSGLNPQCSYTTAGGQGGGYHTRAIRLPPILSPGMLMAPRAPGADGGTAVEDTAAYRELVGGGGGGGRAAAAAGGDGPATTTTTTTTTTTSTSTSTSSPPHPPPPADPYRAYRTPASVFARRMEDEVGYTDGNREANPHRGSSFKRTVGDVFDLDVQRSLHFPRLVPEWLMGEEEEEKKEEEEEKKKKEEAEEKKEAGADAATTGQGEGGEGEGEGRAKEAEPLPRIGGAATVAPRTSSGGSLAEELRSALAEARKRRGGGASASASAAGAVGDRKRPRRSAPATFGDMVPTSLTYPYPPEYTERWVRYATLVEEREAAIARHQDAAAEAAELLAEYDAQRARWAERLEVWERMRAERRADAAAGADAAAYTAADTAAADTAADAAMPPPPEEPAAPALPVPTPIPPLPRSPSPPPWEEEEGDGGERSGSGDGEGNNFPLRPPPRHLLRHLDPAMYAASVPTPAARYAGLLSNSIADAFFVGATAPGINGVSTVGGAGLSSAYATSASAFAGLHSSSYYDGLRGLSEGGGGGAASPRRDGGDGQGWGGLPSPGRGGRAAAPEEARSVYDGSVSGAVEGKALSGLRRLMEGGGPGAARMRDAIVRATVYSARRGGGAGKTFLGSDGTIYRDAGKAFSMYGGFVPCHRCKSNKQGAYHCRVRRRHEDEDYDGGNSSAVLGPLFLEPMESLLTPPMETEDA